MAGKRNSRSHRKVKKLPSIPEEPNQTKKGSPKKTDPEFGRKPDFWNFLHLYSIDKQEINPDIVRHIPGKFYITVPKSELKSVSPKFEVVSDMSSMNLSIKICPKTGQLTLESPGKPQILQEVSVLARICDIILNENDHSVPLPIPNDIQPFAGGEWKFQKLLGYFGGAKTSLVEFLIKKKPMSYYGEGVQLPKTAIMKKIDLKASTIDHVKLMYEAGILRRFKSEYIQQIYGCIYNDGSAILIECGITSLYCCLLANRGKIGQAAKLRWAKQAAEAIQVMSQGRIVHRNLRSENCFITAKGNLKIGNFANAIVLTDYDEEYNYDLSIIKWLPYETLKYKIYNSISESWSLGILLWEIYSEGKEPYPELSSVQFKMKMVKSKNDGCGVYCGFKMKMPNKCPEDVACMVEEGCWHVGTCCRIEPICIFTQLSDAYQRWVLDP